jgi:hypothetical protein
MQVRPPWPSAGGAVMAAVLGLAVLPSLIPPGLTAGHPARPAVDAVVGSATASGELLVVRHAGTASVTVDTTALTGPDVRGWWVDGVSGETVDVGSVKRGRAVTLHPPDVGDGAAHDWTLVLVDATRGILPPA